MTIFYHCTSLENAISIAEEGAILSPWEQKIKMYIEASIRNNIKINKKEMERLALEVTKEQYSEPGRADNVWLCKDFNEFLKGREHYHVAIGIEIDQQPNHTIAIPRKIELTEPLELRFKNKETILKEYGYMNKQTIETKIQEVKKEFAKYNPKIYE